MDMKEYMAKLDLISTGTDDLFPDMIFHPMLTDYGDRYFQMDLDDAKNTAVEVDSRFTRQRIGSIHASTKNVNQYLVDICLYDDYVAYLTSKYGSLEVVEAMDEAGLLTDPTLPFKERPKVRPKSVRKLIESGLIPSFLPLGVDKLEMIDRVREVSEMDLQEIGIGDTDEPDIESSFHYVEDAKDDEMTEVVKDAFNRYRRSERMHSLMTSSSPGIMGGLDFVDQYYFNMRRGAFDTSISPGSGENLSLAKEMLRIAQERGLTADERFVKQYLRENAKKLHFNGYDVDERGGSEALYKEFLKFLSKDCGFDMYAAAINQGFKGERIKAIRASMDSAGIQREYSMKELKKMKKARKKIDKDTMELRRSSSNHLLEQTLLTNRLLMNNTMRFEDMDDKGGGVPW